MSARSKPKNFAMVPLMVIRDTELSHAEKNAFIAVAAYRNSETGWAYPSHAALARDLGLAPGPNNEDRIRKLLRPSVDKGYLERDAGSGHRRSHYRPIWDEDEAAALAAAVKEARGDPSPADLERDFSPLDDPEFGRGEPSAEDGGTRPPETVDPSAVDECTRRPNQKIEPEEQQRAEAVEVDIFGQPLIDRETALNNRAEAAVRVWNERCSPPLSKVAFLTSGRRSHLKARLTNELSELGDWNRYCARIVASPFLTGGNDRGWRADIDWALKPDNVAKVLEGKYDPREAPEPEYAGVHGAL